MEFLGKIAALFEIFRFLNEIRIGLLELCWLVMVLLAWFLYNRMGFIVGLFRILQSMNKRPQFCVIRYVLKSKLI